MRLTFFFFGYVAAFMSPALSCLLKEYRTTEGQCCPMCHEGTVVRRDCTSQSGTRCIACANGTYMNQPNGMTKCFPCSTCDEGQGLSTQRVCTTTTDSVCHVLSGYFCKDQMGDTGCSVAQKHAKCAAGQRIKEPGTSRTDTVCENCEPGYFSLDGLNCTVWTVCLETEIKAKDGTTTSDVVCGSGGSRSHYGVIPPISLVLALIVGLVIAGIIRLCGEKNGESPARSNRHIKQNSPG